MKKRFLPLALALIMVLSMLPVFTLGAGATPVNAAANKPSISTYGDSSNLTSTDFPASIATEMWWGLPLEGGSVIIDLGAIYEIEHIEWFFGGNIQYDGLGVYVATEDVWTTPDYDTGINDNVHNLGAYYLYSMWSAEEFWNRSSKWENVYFEAQGWTGSKQDSIDSNYEDPNNRFKIEFGEPVTARYVMIDNDGGHSYGGWDNTLYFAGLRILGEEVEETYDEITAADVSFAIVDDEPVMSITGTTLSPANEYQFWAYSKVDNSNYTWNMVQSYGIGDTYTYTGTIEDITAPDKTISMLVLVKDAAGNDIKEFKKTIEAPAAVAITSVKFNGSEAGDTVSIDISASSTASLAVALNKSADNIDLFIGSDKIGSGAQNESELNEVLSFAQTGTYKYKITADGAVRYLTVNAYDSTAMMDYNVFKTFDRIETSTSNTRALNLTRLNGLGTISVSGGHAKLSGDTITFPTGMYGERDITFTSRSGGLTDKVIKTVNYKRPIEDGTISIGWNQTLKTTAIGLGETMTFDLSTTTSSALRSEEVLQYRFIRKDASGWVVVQNWSYVDTLSWTPVRHGAYDIIAQVKGSKTEYPEQRLTMTVNVGTNAIIAETLAITGNTLMTPLATNTISVSSSNNSCDTYWFEIYDALSDTAITTTSGMKMTNSFDWIPPTKENGRYYVKVYGNSSNNVFGYGEITAEAPITFAP